MQHFIIIVFLISDIFNTKLLFTNASECALNTECKEIQNCPKYLSFHHLLPKKPYCNLDLNGTYVCCEKPPEQYTQLKDEGIRAVRECKSYQKYRQSCKSDLIISGKKAEPKEFPFMALLYYQTVNTAKYLGGGTLISDKFVLSAAHNFYSENDNPPNMVRLGELDYATKNDGSSPADYKIKHYISHPEYYSASEQEHYNDIVLVELQKEVRFNEYILPACLPLVDGREFTEYIAAGWGVTSTAALAELSSHLLKVELQRFDDDTCVRKVKPEKERLPKGVNKRTQMCAGSRDDNKDTCEGDSGGPLFVDHPDYKCLHLVLGITSFGRGCGTKGFPSVYTRIQLYLDWIEQIVWNEPARLS